VEGRRCRAVTMMDGKRDWDSLVEAVVRRAVPDDGCKDTRVEKAVGARAVLMMDGKEIGITGLRGRVMVALPGGHRTVRTLLKSDNGTLCLKRKLTDYFTFLETVQYTRERCCSMWR
ncbi:hypothetical protein CYMTET_34916, partial [Cymbomonas tetramitiformis]